MKLIVQGISGNYFFDSEKQTEITMTDPSMLRCPTILSAFANCASPEVFVGVVTSKDKLRALLSKDLPRESSLSVSVERENKLRENYEKDDLTFAGRKLLKSRYCIDDVHSLVGRPAPHVYDPDCSIYVSTFRSIFELFAYSVSWCGSKHSETRVKASKQSHCFVSINYGAIIRNSLPFFIKLF